ncbi:discoidin domain-containing protein [Kiritimatiella glycovorans]|uniref:Carbohydrate binding module family protein n=1 Tax=Kiritimatiella glycovorans TaxID=1307763 RepID=A0A0G3EFD3_9BACT|nr:discoidin domain-containing protein [Kiritimatiella glycovorans]AKJ65161.1 Carbohydrate binding module family protein [Kiritimatiella glycovorans]
MKWNTKTVMAALIAAVPMFGRAGFAAELTARADDDPVRTAAIVIPDRPSPAEEIAGAYLEQALSALYPATSFALSGTSGDADARIFVGTPDSLPDVRAWIGPEALDGEEHFVVRHGVRDRRPAGLIAGATGRAALFGVYRLTEALGCGHYLSETTFPAPRESFSFEAWDLEDHPLVHDRIVFNWHNFLSGCSGWDEEHWLSWIEQSQKMGYNTIMVHAYGNNPMFTYTFRGMEKPAGYVATTRRGRDWGNQHVNDVRRLPGGEIFDSAEFGSEAALVPEDRRIAAKQSMMQRAFADAGRREMRVCFALDIDTASVLPQEMITALDEDERFSNGDIWLPRPDTPGGYEFYLAQVRALLELYPQIDMLSLWRRPGAAEWGKLQEVGHLPSAWREEYEAHVREHSHVAEMDIKRVLPAFALSKVAAAFQRAFVKLGREDVRLSTGSWHTDWMPSALEFFPEEFTMMPIDSQSMNRYKGGSFFYRDRPRKVLESARGRVTPIVWAHHDDGEYIGRPLDPHEDLNDTLSDLEAGGFGILHWMNRPLDLYFKNHVRQVWDRSRNEALSRTCRIMARHYFGPEHAQTLGDHLLRWVEDGPIFGRVTSNHFFTEEQYIPEPEENIRECRERLQRLRSADTSGMTARQRERLEYFRTLEEVIIGFCRDQELAYSPAREAIERGEYERARALLNTADPVGTIEQYAELSQIGRPDRGEEAMVVSLGTRWLTDFIAASQAAGLGAVRIHYGPTRHEPLSMGAGRYTYHIDRSRRYWSVLGERETGLPAVTVPDVVAQPAPNGGTAPEEAFLRRGVRIDRPATLTVAPMVDFFRDLAPGAYRVCVWLSPADKTASCCLRVTSGPSDPDVVRIEPVRARFLRIECRGYGTGDWNSIHKLEADALDREDTAAVTASDSIDGYPPEAVLDDDDETRWATRGDHWIQVPLDPGKPLETVKIAWYKGESRSYRYTLKVSDDGEDWQEVSRLSGGETDVRREITLGHSTGGATRVSACEIPIRLKRPASIRLQVEPRDGAVVLHTLTCTPEGE